MKKILVPVDFSVHTDTVCKYAYEIAAKTGGEIRLFHAYFDFMISTNNAFPYTIETNEVFNQEMMIKIRDEAKADMLKLQAALQANLEKDRLEHVKVVYTLTGGMPEDEIINVSETYDPDLIIMGTHGKGEKDVLTGKVSSKVVQNATCRILTVPRDAKFKGFKNILYATDFNDEDRFDLERLIELLSGYNPVIHCVHVDKDNDTGAVKEKMESLKSHIDVQYGETIINFDILCKEDFLACISKYVADYKIDLVAVVHRRKGFLKRLFVKDHTRELLFHSTVPLYIFPGLHDH